MVKLAVLTKLAKFAVETRLVKLAVETTEPNKILDKYPVVPRPITVLVKLAVVNAPIIFVACIEDT